MKPFQFVYDHYVNDRPHPNLVPPQDLSNGYGHLWQCPPFVVPGRLEYYFENHSYPCEYYRPNNFPAGSFYPVAIGWFDFDTDYIGLIPRHIQQHCAEGGLKILFYYHEGDDPIKQKAAIDQQCNAHNLPVSCYQFITGNTVADDIDNFVYFPDHELFYWKANHWHDAVQYHEFDRPYSFTALSRGHKWWRATVMTHMKQSGILDHAQWSYNLVDMQDRFEDNPIEIDSIGMRQPVADFLAHAPYTCDQFDSDSHNRHNTQVNTHYRDSYINIVLETFFSADGGRGTFITEKVFKPIKHAQPFVLLAPPGSLQLLRDLGYYTFDQEIDPSYDLIENNTLRWKKIHTLLEELCRQDLKKLYQRCREGIIHNQKLFLSNKQHRLLDLRNSLDETCQ